MLIEVEDYRLMSEHRLNANNMLDAKEKSTDTNAKLDLFELLQVGGLILLVWLHVHYINENVRHLVFVVALRRTNTWGNATGRGQRVAPLALIDFARTNRQ